MTVTTLQGSCLCGAVQYEVTGKPERLYHCHCQRCRKATGTGHATNLMIRPGSIRWIQGEELITTYKVPQAIRYTTRFCKQCGGLVPRFVEQINFFIIPAGSLDSDAPLKPQARIFWDSRAEWSCSDDLPTYPEYMTD